MKKIWFLKAVKISLLLFIALFFITSSIQAQAYYDFPYNYDDFYTFDSWFPSLSMNYQNNYRYGQSNWGAWPQANISSIYPGWGSASFPWSSLNSPIWENALYNSPSLGSSNPALMPRSTSISYPPAPIPASLPDLALMSYNSSGQTYQIPFIQRPFTSANVVSAPGGWFGGYFKGGTYQIFFPETGGSSPVLLFDNQLTTWEGTQKIKTITKEDDGETVTVHVGDIFRVLLAVDDYISNNDFGSYSHNTWGEVHGPGWEDDDIWRDEREDNPIKLKSMGMKDSGYEQENYYEAIHIGERELNFNYYSPEDPDAISDTFRVTIIVVR